MPLKSFHSDAALQTTHRLLIKFIPAVEMYTHPGLLGSLYDDVSGHNM